MRGSKIARRKELARVAASLLRAASGYRLLISEDRQTNAG
jgi:hypothetical protein